MNIPNEDPECQFAHDIQNSISFQSTEVLHFFCSVLGILLLIRALNFDYKRHTDWNIDKIVTYISSAAMITHNLATALIVVVHSWKKYHANDYCDLTITTSVCLFFRIPAITSIIVVSLGSLVVVCSYTTQLVTNCNGASRYYENIFGMTLIVLATTAESIHIFYEEDGDEAKFYCIAESDHNRTKMMSMFKTLACLDAICGVLCFVLVVVMRHKLQRNSHNFKLNLHFEINTNLRVLRANLLKCVVRILIFDTFLLFNFIIRVTIDHLTNRLEYIEWLNANYNIQVYTILYALLIHYDEKFRAKPAQVIDVKREGEHHHRQMMQMWLSGRRSVHTVA